MNNILIIKPSSFGDIVQALPVAARLRACLPPARISWLANSRYVPLLERNPCINRVIPFRRDLWREGRRLAGAAASLWGLCRLLRAERFDAVLDLQGLFRSGFLAAVTGAPVRIGFANARELAHLFYTRKVPVPDPDMHSVERYLLFCSAAGCGEGAAEFPLGIGEKEEKWVRQVLGGGVEPSRRFIGLSPSGRWKTKRWPDEYYARLADALAAKGAAVVLIGGPACEAAVVAGLMKRKAIVADGITDPLKMAALMRSLDLLVTNDSGPMHLAAAAGTRVVALFGPTNPRRTGPYGEGHRIICAPVECRPCYERECPRGDDCMRAIRVETVLSTIEGLLPWK